MSPPAASPAAGPAGAAPAAPYLILRIELDLVDQLQAALQVAIRGAARQRLEGLLKSGDTLAPHGSGFLIQAGVSLEEAEPLAQTILDALGMQPFDIGQGQFLRRTGSVGWAPFPWQPAAPEGLGRDAIQRLAERALFLAQRSGRNQAVGILPMDDDRSGASVRLVRVPGPDLLDEPTTPLPVG